VIDDSRRTAYNREINDSRGQLAAVGQMTAGGQLTTEGLTREGGQPTAEGQMPE